MADKRVDTDDGFFRSRIISTQSIMEVNDVAGNEDAGGPSAVVPVSQLMDPARLLNEICIANRRILKMPQYELLEKGRFKKQDIFRIKVWVRDMELIEIGHGKTELEAKYKAATQILDKICGAGERQEGINKVTSEVVTKCHKMIKTFEELKLLPELFDGVFNMRLDYSISKILETALPLLVEPPQSIISQSQSGLGKTAAFVLAMLSRTDTSKGHPHVVCMSPTVELAIETGEIAKKMAKFCPSIKIKYVVRGEKLTRGQLLTEHILIGTPGKLLDWGLKFRCFDPSKVEVFVLDEADVMIATQGHQDQSIRIHKLLPKTCQMMLFSATFDEDVMKFAEMIIRKPKLHREQQSLDNIKQHYVVCNTKEDKYRSISNIYGVLTIGQSMIICHTPKTASWLAETMAKEGHAVALLSDELEMEQRINITNRFREGKEKVLITTNVLARGIDFEQVTTVVNFDLPVDQTGKADCETYLHCIGRTGRFGKSGVAINLVDGPRSMSVLKQIEDHFRRPILKLDAEDVDGIKKLNKD